MARNRYFDRRDLTLVQHAYYMSVDYPGFVGRMMKNAIEWVGSLKPTPMSDTYLMVDFLCRVVSGEAAAGSDVSEVKWVTEADLAALNLRESIIRVVGKALAGGSAGL